MQVPAVNWLAVFVAAIVMFVLGGLWYSPVLFARRWLALQGRTEEQERAQAAAANMPLMYISAFFGAMAWVGFVAPTTYATAMFSGKPKQLWFIDSTYYLVSFMLAGLILAAWR